MAEPELLTIPQVAEMLNISVPRAYELARGEILPVVRIGRQVRVPADKLQQWIDGGGSPLSSDWRHDD